MVEDMVFKSAGNEPMVEPYEEIVGGEVWLRSPPSQKHEEVLQRLYALVENAVRGHKGLELLPPRSVLQIEAGTLLRPDLIVQDQQGHVVLVAEVIYPGDHKTDTVVKKAIYEESSIERLWMIDLRYECIEVYERTPYGLAFRNSFAGMERVEDARWPQLSFYAAELFESRPAA